MSPSTPLIDVDALLESLGGDLELLDELTATFDSEVAGWLIALRAALAAGDAQTVFQVPTA